MTLWIVSDSYNSWYENCSLVTMSQAVTASLLVIVTLYSVMEASVEHTQRMHVWDYLQSLHQRLSDTSHVNQTEHA